MAEKLDNAATEALPRRGRRVRSYGIRLIVVVMGLVILFACCDAEAWPTLVWEHMGTSCGNITIVPGVPAPHPQDPDGARTGEQCFARAYQQCSVATLDVSSAGLEANDAHRFVIEPYGFTCAVGDIWRIPSGITVPHLTNGVGLCFGGVHQKSDGLHVVGCQSTGDYFVPGGG